MHSMFVLHYELTIEQRIVPFVMCEIYCTYSVKINIAVNFTDIVFKSRSIYTYKHTHLHTHTFTQYIYAKQTYLHTIIHSYLHTYMQAYTFAYTLIDTWNQIYSLLTGEIATWTGCSETGITTLTLHLGN